MRISFVNEKERSTVTGYNMMKFQNIMPVKEGEYAKDHILYDAIYLTCPEAGHQTYSRYSFFLPDFQ